MITKDGGLKIKVRGIVQGVGFRPFIFNLAEKYRLTGWVKNTSSGVEIALDGDVQDLDKFLFSLQNDLPPLARIDELETSRVHPGGYAKFEILASQPAFGEFQPVPPDIAICPDCRRELFSTQDPRFRYPFINCTNCGPRFSIIEDIPYDRPFTSMAGFPLCSNCEDEYHNPRNRRFHAQPIACPTCGPRVWLETQGKTLAEDDSAIVLARKLLGEGKILAIKGLGGYHLACDATNQIAVAELRRRKKRSDKPFALMAFDLPTVQRYCQVIPVEAALLQSRQAPIVLLEPHPNTPIAAEIAPAQRTLGVMLAYTPLHLLLMEPAPNFPEMLVMTSGNLSEEPIAYRDEEAHTRLSSLADAFLMHNRPIRTRVDDSVVTQVRGEPLFVRRARGFAPDPLQLIHNYPSTLAVGGELKNAFCLTRDRYAFLSHYIGDMENMETLQSFEEGIAHYEHLFRIKPSMLACDLHPNYLATRYAEERASRMGLPLARVQHHHAHIAACLADNGWDSQEPVIGFGFDGTGLGTDQAIWGGEVLIVTPGAFTRPFHLSYTPLPGGDLAARKPARMALSHLYAAGLNWDPILPPVEFLCADERSAVRAQIAHQINTPLTSSMGRFFDAASALLGIRQSVNYEGQAAIEMEALADPHEEGLYSFEIMGDEFNPSPLWAELIADFQSGVALSVLAARFHNSVAHLVLQISQIVSKSTGSYTVALSGGVWQNRYLIEKTLDILEKNGFTVLTHHQIPANDGGIALGQAVIAGQLFVGKS